MGCRGGTSLFLPGYIFGYMFRGALTAQPLLDKIEKFIGQKTGEAMDRNVVNMAAKVTPTRELWVYKVSDSNVNVMLPYNATQAYYWDLINIGDDCMVIRNAFRRLYTKPDALTLNTSTIESQVKTASNLELALRVRKAGTADPYRYIPQHESVNTCVLSSRTMRRNGVVVVPNDVKYIPSQTFEIDSTYNCFHPDQVDPLATLRLIHYLTPEKIQATATITFLQGCDVEPGYSIMNNCTLASKQASVFRQDTQVFQTQALGSSVAAPGQDTVTGCAMRASTDTTVILADWSSNRGSVMQNNQYNSTSLRQWFEGSGQKFYNQPFNNATIPAGLSFTWSGEWRMAEWGAIF
jgi:hypothetical protein